MPDPKRPEVSIDQIMQPISESNPSGDWLRYEPVYDQIREARRQDDPDLSLGIWQRDLKKSDWEEVESLCLDVLIHKSKDLQVAAWLAESWTAMDEFPGMIRGVNLMESLCRAFWPTLYPPIEEEDLDYRLRVLEWLDDTLTQRIIRIPLTGNDIQEHGYTLADWMSANQLETVAKRTPEGQKLIQTAESENQPTLAKVQQALKLTTPERLQALHEGITQTQSAIQQFKKTIDQLTQNQSPSYKTLIDRLAEMSRFIHSSSQPHDVSRSLPPEPTAEVSFAPKSQEEPSLETLTNRRSAYQQLQQIAEFLDAIEPHSPTPHVLKRIVTWQDKSLADIFAEFGDSPQELTLLTRLMGKT